MREANCATLGVGEEAAGLSTGVGRLLNLEFGCVKVGKDLSQI
jgi:hypothetical protein